METALRERRGDISAETRDIFFDPLRETARAPVKAPAPQDKNAIFISKRPAIRPRTAMQGEYIRAMHDHELTFGMGPAGTGKTWLAIAFAVAALKKGEVERIILTRPAVEAGEKLGFLPGDMNEKLDPYLRPLYDALHDMMDGAEVQKMRDRGEIEIAPIAFMRGRTLSRACIVVDEAQNTTQGQMKMVLTRLGEGSRMIITGDPTQVDLPPGTPSGLSDAYNRLGNVEGIKFIEFGDQDVVRHKLVGRIVQAYGANGPV